MSDTANTQGRRNDNPTKEEQNVEDMETVIQICKIMNKEAKKKTSQNVLNWERNRKKSDRYWYLSKQQMQKTQ